MKKSKRKQNNQKHRRKTAPTPPPAPARRDVLKLARNGAIGLGLASVTGFFAVRTVQATLHERDLTRLSDGKLTVVQIHDPSCSMCNALQKSTRAALDCFGECEIQYLIADIKTTEGQVFAQQYGVPHVTLMLFDKDAQNTATYNGVREKEELKRIFTAHRDQYA